MNRCCFIEGELTKSIVNILVIHRLTDRSRKISTWIFGFILLTILAAISYVLTIGFFKLVHVFSSAETVKNKCFKRIVGYSIGFSYREITEAQIEKLTHIIYQGTSWKPNGKIEFVYPESSFFDLRTKTKSVNPNIKVMFSPDTYLNNGQNFPSFMNESRTRKKHIDAISSFILVNQLDGVDLFYKWPKSKKDKDTFVFFVRELRYELENMKRISSRNSSYVLSIVAPREMEESGSIIFDLISSVDFFNVKTDNYSLPWHKTGITGPTSPLYSKNNESIDSTMKAYICITKLPSKFNFVISFSGVLWKNVEDPLTDDEQYRTVGTKSNSALLVPFNGEWNLPSAAWDDVSKTPYIWDPKNQTLLTFENKRSMKEKMKYVVSKNLGGITIDLLEWDDDSNTLLNALTSIDLCPKRKNKQDKVEYDCGKVEKKSLAFLNF